ncbi:hypothetical protein B0F90DRAFT_1755463, partial [Multifurca ochricompacta]
EVSLERRETNSEGIVVSGHPGIGKTCFLFYFCCAACVVAGLQLCKSLYDPVLNHTARNRVHLQMERGPLSIPMRKLPSHAKPFYGLARRERLTWCKQPL